MAAIDDTKKTFVEQHAAVVLKLKIKAVNGTTQIRRVKVDRLAAKDGSGDISFNEMRRLSVIMSHGDHVKNHKEYTVTLTYYDSDNDMVSIGSKEELMDAIEQFSMSTPPVVRITAYVTPSSESAAAAAAAAASTTVGAAAKPSTNTDRTAERGTSTRGDVPAPIVIPVVPVQKVLDQFVGILSTAVHHLQEGLTTTQHPLTFHNDTATNVPAPIIPSTTAANCGDLSAENVAPTIHQSGGDGTDPKSTGSEEGKQQDSAAFATDAGAQGLAAAEASNQPSSGNEEAKSARPFIHGRHTCDSCLSTPIIGKRYHSVNLPDYDLCQNCFRNYQGSDIQFESVELDRDCPFQDRWHRRHHRNLNLRMRSAVRHNRCVRSGPRGLSQRFEPSGLSARGHLRHPMTGGLRRHCHRVNKATIGAAQLKSPPQANDANPSNSSSISGPIVDAARLSAPPTPSESDFNIALKEAIRRSLSDIASKEAAIVCASKTEDLVQDNMETANEKDEEKNDRVMGKTVLEDEENDQDKTYAAAVESGIPRSVDVPTSDLSIHLKDIMDDSSLPGMEDAVANILKGAMEKAMDAASVDSEKLVKQQDDATHPRKGSPQSSRSCSKKTDQSFSSDAIGNGDVAEAIGATLDMVVGQISAMLDEQDTETNEASSPGELIVDPDHSATMDGDQNETDGDWSVVKSDFSTGSNGTSEEEQIARAASMLGSALFNSDMKTSVENVSSRMSAAADSRSVSSFSVPSSVPTDSNFSVSPAQLARWSTQLEQLRCLGFEEEKCVEVLERLSAANIGVESEEEISLELVVTKLLEEQKHN